MLYQQKDIIAERYNIKDFIGEGGMQEVYKAKDRLLSRRIALETPKNASADKRFYRSAVVSARVNHANVAKTLDYVRADSRQFLIEELIVGKDLSRILREDVESLDPLTSARIFHRLARGVAASHHAGVVHRDLKPSNIMAVGGIKLRDVKITDFGIAKMAEEELQEAIEGGETTLTASQTAIGALPYMAPEMITSVRDADKPADSWSLGALTYELLTGDKPFGVGYAAVPAILAGQIPVLPKRIRDSAQFGPTSVEIYEILQQCVQVDPEKRPTADQLVRKCEALCYSNVEPEIGAITRFSNPKWGFITPETGKSVFFHVESVFEKQRVALGDKVLFSRHLGGGSDRAFPVMKVS